MINHKVALQSKYIGFGINIRLPMPLVTAWRSKTMLRISSRMLEEARYNVVKILHFYKYKNAYHAPAYPS